MRGSHTKIFPLCHDFSFISARGPKDHIGQKCFSPLAAEKSWTPQPLGAAPIPSHSEARHVHRVPVSSLRQVTDAFVGTREASKGITVSTRRCWGKVRDPHTWEQEAFPQLPLPLEQTHMHFLNQNKIRNLTHNFSRLVILPICEMVYTVTKFKQHVLCFQ